VGYSQYEVSPGLAITNAIYPMPSGSAKVLKRLVRVIRRLEEVDELMLEEGRIRTKARTR